MRPSHVCFSWEVLVVVLGVCGGVSLEGVVPVP